MSSYWSVVSHVVTQVLLKVPRVYDITGYYSIVLIIILLLITWERWEVGGCPGWRGGWVRGEGGRGTSRVKLCNGKKIVNNIILGHCIFMFVAPGKIPRTLFWRTDQ